MSRRGENEVEEKKKEKGKKRRGKVVDRGMYIETCTGMPGTRLITASANFVIHGSTDRCH